MRIIILLLAAVTLWSSSAMPSLFSQMGDPLYGYARQAGALKDDAALGSDAAAYVSAAETTQKIGLAADAAQEKSVQADYLGRLRELQKVHDRLMARIKRELIIAIVQKDTARFLKIVATQPPVAEQDRTLFKRIALYYNTNGLEGRLPYLDRLMHQDTGVETVYTKGDDAQYTEGTFKPVDGYAPVAAPQKRPEVILLGTSTCPYCVKARTFLRAQKIPFKDYNLNASATGRQLYRQNNGRGVPLILIGNKRISGFDPKAILDAYGQ